jgi:hypothetical protein
MDSDTADPSIGGEIFVSERAAEGTCHECRATFAYSLIHNGFNESAYAYCNRCGTTAVLSGWASNIPPDASFQAHVKIAPGVESFLAPWPCGGRFTADAVPRCPSCHVELDPEAARDFVERNAPGTRQGWRWEGSWDGLYAIVIEGKVVGDPWRQPNTPSAPPA